MTRCQAFRYVATMALGIIRGHLLEPEPLA